LVIGQILRPHGVRGEFRVAPYTDEPDRFARLETVFLADDPDVHPDPVPYAVDAVRLHQRLVLLKLHGVDDREAAAALRSLWILVAREDALPLAEGEYYLYQLEGMVVRTEEGETLGALLQVLETGANRVFVVHGERGDILIPDIPDVVTDIDFATGMMTVRLMPGLLP
jgi:16S rRNA processing protein RimM